MSNIPSKSDVQKKQADAADAQARVNRASSVQRLTDALVEAIQRNDMKPSVMGGFADDVIEEVVREFASQGWTVRKTGSSRSSVYFEIS